MSVNKVILIGNLGQNPELKYTTNGEPVCRFSIATSDHWVDKGSGQKQTKTEWHKVVCFGKLAELTGQFLEKGRQVFVEGKIQTKHWETRDGAKMHTTEVNASIVQFLGKKPGDLEQSEEKLTKEESIQSIGPTTWQDDDLPF